MGVEKNESVIVIGNIYEKQCLLPLLKLISKAIILANELQSKVGVYLYGGYATFAAEQLKRYKLNMVYLLEQNKSNPLDSECDILYLELKEKNPNIVLFLSSDQNKVLASRLAVAFHTGLTADCIDLEIDLAKKKLIQIRPAFQGNILAKIESKKDVLQMAIVNPVYFVNTMEYRDGATEIKLLYAENKSKCKGWILNSKRISVMEDSLNNYIVTIGRGVSTIENRDIILQFARTIGAGLGATRAAVDAGLMDKEYQIGLTGNKITCDIIFMFGVSGAIQHMVGLQHVNTIVAINQDQDAQIFQYADYEICGDVKVITEQLLKEYKERGK